jgi:three-Cys-motif partner protein
MDALPRYDEHHKAKHRLLEEYLRVWLAKLAQTHPKVAIVDGFSSAGRYRDRRIGSPLILLQAYLQHVARRRFKAPPHFVFIESNRKFAMHLQSEVDALGDLGGAEVDVIHAQYQDAFPDVVHWLATHYRTASLPTFAFVDPCGYDSAPFALLRAYRARLGTKAEAMTYVPVAFMARFIGTTMTENALDKLFGSREAWEEVRAQAAPGSKASQVLADAYAAVLGEEFNLVSRFAVDPASRNRYYLFFGTDHIDGLKAMKAAYWKVDPEDGRGYRQEVLTHHGQVELFAPAVETPKAPEEDLGQLLREHFETRTFSIEDAELVTLTKTGFRETHIRDLALYPAYNMGGLEIVQSNAKRSRSFPPGTRMRFRP